MLAEKLEHLDIPATSTVEKLRYANVPPMLTPEEFAEYMQVGRTTIHKWMNDSTLQPGRDFIQKGKVIRFPLTGKLIDRLLEASLDAPDEDDDQEAASPVQKSIVRHKNPQKVIMHSPHKGRINLDY